MGGGKGGGGSTATSSPDTAYNARIAAVQEASQSLSDKYFAHWQANQAPLEAAQAAAALGLVPLQTQVDTGNLELERNLLPKTGQLAEASLDSQLQLLPGQTALTKARTDSLTSLVPQTTDATSRFLTAATQGVNAEDWAQRAGTDASLQAANKDSQLLRGAARLGLNPASGAFTRARADNATQSALGIAAATTAGRRAGEDENWKRLSSAGSLGAGLLTTK
jgi:hypothetical protein